MLPVIQQFGKELLNNNFTLQQDGATCHTSLETLDAFKTASISIIPPKHWPPNSPDLNPLDYFFWNEVETRLKQKKYENRNELIEKIKDIFFL